MQMLTPSNDECMGNVDASVVFTMRSCAMSLGGVEGAENARFIVFSYEAF
jgi:hypothetical protein